MASRVVDQHGNVDTTSTIVKIVHYVLFAREYALNLMGQKEITDIFPKCCTDLNN